ncbi:MAG: hypothetical protein ABIN89_25215 [Chitinophagaceae bacterium]
MESRNFLLSGLLAGTLLPRFTRLITPIDKGSLKPYYIPPSGPPPESAIGAGFHVKVHAVQSIVTYQSRQKKHTLRLKS